MFDCIFAFELTLPITAQSATVLGTPPVLVYVSTRFGPLPKFGVLITVSVADNLCMAVATVVYRVAGTPALKLACKFGERLEATTTAIPIGPCVATLLYSEIGERRLTLPCTSSVPCLFIG